MVRLAIFDVDYTLTKRETLIEFYLFMLKQNPKLLKHIPRNLITVVFYLFKLYDEKKAKQNFIRFIDGIKEEQMEKIVREFYEKRLSKILYKDAIDTIMKMKSEGYKIILISASAEFYLKELYNIKEVDMVIGTKFRSDDGIYNYNMEGNNCKGQEKVRRLMEVVENEKIDVDFKNSYMFSDSLADLPLFNLVGNPYLINYRKKHETIKILKWK